MNHDATKSSGGFDFTGKIRLVCQEIVSRLDELSHVDLSRVALSFSQTRKIGKYGIWASTTPMRFENGSLTTMKRGRQWTVQRLYGSDNIEMLYVISFYLPRFMDLTLREKLTTIVHELWHISPEFNGDLRRFSGRCYAHGNAQKDFDFEVDQLTDKWLARVPEHQVFDFLKLDFNQLHSQFGPVHGIKVKTPKLIPLESITKKQQSA